MDLKILFWGKQKKNAALMFGIINTETSVPAVAWKKAPLFSFVSSPVGLWLKEGENIVSDSFGLKHTPLLFFTYLPFLSHPSVPPWGTLIKCVAATTGTHFLFRGQSGSCYFFHMTWFTVKCRYLIYKGIREVCGVSFCSNGLRLSMRSASDYVVILQVQQQMHSMYK